MLTFHAFCFLIDGSAAVTEQDEQQKLHVIQTVLEAMLRIRKDHSGS